jgi:hypothetical protein
MASSSSRFELRTLFTVARSFNKERRARVVALLWAVAGA